MKVRQLLESARSDALDMQQYLIDEEGYETEMRSVTWVMRNTMGSNQVTDINGGVLVLAKKPTDKKWRSAYHFPVDAKHGVGIYFADPGNKNKSIPGEPELAFDSTLADLAKAKRWGMPDNTGNL